MILDKVKLAEVHRQFKAMFLKSLGQAPRWSMDGPTSLVQRVPVTGNELKPKFASRSSGVNEWLDQRQYGDIRVFDFTVPVKEFSNGVKVRVPDLEDDMANLALYAPEIADLADDFHEHKHQQIIDLLIAGFGAGSGTAYDGQFYFDSDHRDGPEGSAQRNVRSIAFDSTGLYTAFADMALVRKPNGLLANLRPTHGLFPEALRANVEAELLVPFLAGGASNPNYKKIEPIFDGRLDAAGFTTGWFVFDLSKAGKPFIHGDRKPVGLRRTNMNDESAMDGNVLKFGGDGRYNSGFNHWQQAWGSDGP